ncbi:MAG: hypothetical protein ACE5J1_06070 [Nitrospiria bacterium]
MKLILLFSSVWLFGHLYSPIALAINEEARALLDALYEKGRAARQEELMDMLIAIAKDPSLTRKQKIKEMKLVIHLSGSRLTEKEKREAIAAAFKGSGRLRVEAYLEAHPGLDERIKEAIREGRLLKGMSKDEVEASLGKPEEINKALRRSGFQERWDYYSKRQVLFFIDDTLRAWKE